MVRKVSAYPRILFYSLEYCLINLDWNLCIRLIWLCHHKMVMTLQKQHILFWLWHQIAMLHTFFVAKIIYAHFFVANTINAHFFAAKMIWAHFFCCKNDLRTLCCRNYLCIFLSQKEFAHTFLSQKRFTSFFCRENDLRT